MTALATDKNTVRFGAMHPDSPHRLGVKAATLIYAGAAVVNNAGVAEPASTGTGLVTMGVARKRYDNSAGAANDMYAECDAGDYLFVNSAGGDAVTAASIGADCYWVDDQTVMITATGKSRAGTVIDVNPPGYTGVVVRVGAGH